MNRKWLILDCNYLCHRVKHTGAYSVGEGLNPSVLVYLFLRTVNTLQEKFNTKYVVFCWDYGKGKRYKMYPGYKGSRKKELPPEEEVLEDQFRVQMELIRTEYLASLGYRNIFQQKGYEADDVITSVARNLPEGDDCVIVTADQDLYQVISPTICMYNPQKRKLTTLQSFKREYGILPKRWAEVKAIAGCPTDCVIGIERVGTKTAIKWIKKELNPNNKIYSKIKKQIKVIKATNLPIVKLPLKGTKVFRLKKDHLSNTKWSNLCTQLRMNSLRNKSPFWLRRR